MLGIMHWTGLSRDIFGDAHPELFTDIALLYIAIATLSLLLYWAKILRAYTTHLLAVLIFDFITLVVMIYASGNLTGGLGYLLLIPMAIGSTFLRGQANIGLAAFGTILVIGMSLININNGFGDSKDFFSAGITGVSLFVTAIAFRIFSEKVQTSQYTAKKQTEQADYLQLISQRIVETMRTGIIVVDRDLRIQLINHAAALLLTVNNRFEGVVRVKPIYERLEQWQNDGVIPSSFNFSLENNQTLKVSFAPLEDSRFPSLMLFVEDTQRLNQEAQQLKLASLGRLTASIAHEIRNPLGAISHASQLLDE
jgi:two-component system sensor histidine kinase PilS (NtrC family)